MAVSKTQLEQETLRLLNEAANSGIGELQSGDGSAPTIATTQSLDDYLLQGAQRLARTCIALRGKGQKTGYTGRVLALKDLVASEIQGVTSATGYTCWRLVTSPLAGTTRLVYTREEPLALTRPDYQTTTGAAVYWYGAGNESIGLCPSPTAGVTIDAAGLWLPPAPTGTDATPWLTDDLSLFLLPRYVAVVMCGRNIMDTTLEGMLGLYVQQYQRVVAEQWMRLPHTIQPYFPKPLALAAPAPDEQQG